MAKWYYFGTDTSGVLAYGFPNRSPVGLGFWREDAMGMDNRTVSRGVLGGGGASGSALFAEEMWGELGRSLRLGGRELEVVRHVFADEKERAIALALGISPHTVNTYLQRLYHKLGVGSRAQLIVRVVARYLELHGREGWAGEAATHLSSEDV